MHCEYTDRYGYMPDMVFRSVALVVMWSSGFIGAELGARYAGPDTVLTWRCLVIAAVLLPWSLRALTRPPDALSQS